MAELLFNDPDFMTDGELETAAALSEGLPEQWFVICNKVLPSRYSSRELDFIVIGDRLVYAIDEKSWRGRITGSDTIWVRDDGSSERSPLNKIDMVSKVLADHIRDRTPRMRDVRGEFVLGCVSLTRSIERPSVTDPRVQSRVFLISDICERILSLDSQFGTPEVGVRRNEIRNSLYDLNARPKVPKKVNDLTIEEFAPGLPGVLVCNAVHDLGMKRLLTMYQVRPDDQEARDFFLQEFHAYNDLARLGVCPDVQDPFPWSDDFFGVASSAPLGRSLSSIDVPSTEEGLIQELERAIATFGALAIVHDHGLVHRALAPDNIYLYEEGPGWQAQFIGFYACRRPGRARRTISPLLNRFKIDDPYAAPELDLGYEYADQSSDTFSVSLSFLQRLSRRPITELRQLEYPLGMPLDWSLDGSVDLPELDQFFTDTLGEDPVIGDIQKGKGRLSAAQCEEQLSQVLERLN